MDPLFEFGLQVKAIQRELERAGNEAMRPLGLTGPQADALVVIGQSQPLALKQLGGLLIAEAGHPSRLVDRLVEAGLVERRAAEGDRRRVELTLTPAGARLAQKVSAAREQILELGRQIVGDDDIDAVNAVLRKWLEASPLGEVIDRRRELARSRPAARRAGGASSRSRRRA